MPLLFGLIASLWSLTAPMEPYPFEGRGPVEPSIGRLNGAGYAHRLLCTASLIAPDQVLTAAHCTGTASAEGLFFLPGYDKGSWDEALEGGMVEADPAGRDVARLCLGSPSQAAPLMKAGSGPRPGETVYIIGYGAPRVHVQTRQACTVGRIEANGRFLLACQVTPGTSGAPVLRRTGGTDGWELVGVVSASNRAATQATDVTGLTFSDC